MFTPQKLSCEWLEDPMSLEWEGLHMLWEFTAVGKSPFPKRLGVERPKISSRLATGNVLHEPASSESLLEIKNLGSAAGRLN